jgi:hypothetical protein
MRCSEWLWARFCRLNHLHSLFPVLDSMFQFPPSLILGSLGHSAPAVMYLTSILRIFVLVAAITLSAPSRAEEPCQLVFPNSDLETIARLYSRLTGKKIGQISEELRERRITVETKNAKISRERAIRFVEAALYVHGIEIVVNADGSFSFVQYALIDPQSPRRARIINKSYN